MKTVFIFFTLFSYLFQDNLPKSIIGKWTLVCFQDIDNGKNECEEAEKQKFPIKLEFKENGIIIGHTSTNDISANYKTQADNKIKIYNFVGTKLGEFTEWGGELWKTIGLSSSFKFNKDTLIILYDNDKKVMKFISTQK